MLNALHLHDSCPVQFFRSSNSMTLLPTVPSPIRAANATMSGLLWLRAMLLIMIMASMLPDQAWAQQGALIGSDGGPRRAEGGIAPNANCSGAVVATLEVGSPVSIAGNNTGSLLDPVLDATVVWEAFVTSECADVTIAYCGTAPSFPNYLNTLIVGCPRSNVVYNSGTNVVMDACGDGNVEIQFLGLPAGTYYYPVVETQSSSGNYTLVLTAAACGTAPPANAFCDGALELTSSTECVPVTGTVEGATSAENTGTGCGNADIADAVWYSFTATGVDMRVEVVPSALFRPRVEVFEGACNTPVARACAVGTNFGITVQMVLTGLSVGSTYLVRVADQYGGTPLTTTFTICATGFSVEECEAYSGTVTPYNPSFELTGDVVNITAAWNSDRIVPPGYQGLFLLTRADDQVVVQGAFTPAFNISDTGQYVIHALVYNPTTLNMSGLVFGTALISDVNALLIQGGGSICGSLDLVGGGFRVESPPECEAEGGSMSAVQSIVCFEGPPVWISATANGDAVVPDGYQTGYLAATDQGVLLAGLLSEPTAEVLNTGSYRIHALVFHPDSLDPATIVQGGTIAALDASLVQGGGSICAGLDVMGAEITVERCCDARSGTLIADVSSVCFNYVSVTIEATTDVAPVVPPGFQTVYVLTHGAGHVITDTNITSSFDVTAMGDYSIRALVYDPATLDLGFIAFGVTTAGEVDALLIQGGGIICASLDMSGAAITVADCRPVNDDCANAISVPIALVDNCANNFIYGDNTYAVQEAGNSPGCDATTAYFADVWYRFNSGANTSISIVLGPISMTSWALAVSDACSGGTELACELNPAVPIDLTTAPNTDYWVRIYSNTASGHGGEFALCVSGASPTYVCDGGEVISGAGGTVIDICGDLGPAVIEMSTTSTSIESYTYMIANTADVIVAPVVQGSSLDISGLPAASYHVWGISHNGVLEGASVGMSVQDVTSAGYCAILGVNFVLVNVEVCSGIAEVGADDRILFPNPSNGDFSLRYPGQNGKVRIEVIDMGGRSVLQEVLPLVQGQIVTIGAAGRLAQGLYTVRVTSDAGVSGHRLMVQ